MKKDPKNEGDPQKEEVSYSVGYGLWEATRQFAFQGGRIRES